nr:MAG TPA: holin [Caudoviricetes sp.]
MMFKNCVFKPNVNTVKWCKAAGIRAIKTMAQTAVGVISSATLVSSVDWKMVLSASVISGVVSVLTSIAGISEVEAEE